MANPEHLEILKRGAEVWNRWRKWHPEIQPDLDTANLVNADLEDVNLSQANLQRANLEHVNCVRTKLFNANLRHAFLIHADLRDTDLRDANLSHANLFRATLSNTILGGADLTSCQLGYTFWVALDLSEIKGLEYAYHLAPSSIGIDTIYKSRGKVPEVFLRGCGVPNEFIAYMHSLAAHPIQFYSCFISYSNKDQDFAERLYARSTKQRSPLLVRPRRFKDRR